MLKIIWKIGCSIAIILLLNACASTPNYAPTQDTKPTPVVEIQDSAPTQAVNLDGIHKLTPHYVAKSKFGNPSSYVVFGKRYQVLKTAKDYKRRGIISWYGTKFDGQLTSSHERYNMLSFTAASPELPIPCYARVTNLENGRQLIVRVNDRGPFAKNRIMDLSYAAAIKLGYAKKGTALAKIEVINFDVPGKKIPTKIKISKITKKPKLYLQFGAFSHYENATQLKHKIYKLSQSTAFIDSSKLNNNPIYQVKIGPLKNIDQSDEYYQRFRNLGFKQVETILR